MKERLSDGSHVAILGSSSLSGCKGIVRGELYGNCFIIEFTHAVKKYFQLPCTQVIDVKHVKNIDSEANNDNP